MFRTRGRKIIRDLWVRKGRTALAATSIFIGVVGVVILISVSDLLIRQLEQDLQEEELAMMQVFLTVPGGTELDNDAYLEQLGALPGVARVEGRATYPLFWKQPGDVRFENGFILAAWEPFEEMQIQPVRLTSEGRYPVAGQHEIAVEKRMAERYGLDVGDALVLRILGDATDAQDMREERWTISGIVFQPYFNITGDGLVPNDVSIYATFEDARYIAGFTGFSMLYARHTDFETAQAQSDDFSTAIAQATPYVPVFNFIDDPAQNVFITISQQITRVLTILGLVAMVVSGFLVTNVVNTIVVEQKRQIGVMKSLGATRSDNLLMYTGIAMGYGIIGMVPGVLLGIPIGSMTAERLASLANVLLQGFNVSLTGVLLGAAMGLLVPFLAALIPVYLGTRVTILEAMTDLGIASNYGKGRAARLIGALPVPITFRQALSNVVRKKWRLMLTGLTLTLAVAAFMGVSGVFFAVNDLISDLYDSLNYQIQVAPNDGQDFERMRALIKDNVEQVKDVSAGIGSEIYLEGYVNPQTETNMLMVVGFDTKSEMFELNLEAGTAWQDDPEREGIVLASGVTQQMDKRVGDTVRISAGGKTTELEIIGVIPSMFDQAFMEWRALSRLTGLTLGAPTPNDYNVLAQIQGYNGSLPDAQVAVAGMDEMASNFLAGTSLTNDVPGVIISSAMAQAGNYTVGDELTLRVGENSATYPVLSIFELPPTLVSEGDPTDIVGMFWQALAQLEGRDLDGESIPSRLFVQLNNPDPTVPEVDQAIDRISETLLQARITATYTNEVSSAKEAAQQILAFGLILNIAAGVMAAVGAVGLLAALSMSVFERQKEIGVMRAIGAGSATIVSQFLFEGVLVGLVAWVVGVPLSYLLNRGLWSAFPYGGDAIEYPLISPILGLVGMVVIAAIASLWPSISAARKTVSEIIRYQ